MATALQDRDVLKEIRCCTDISYHRPCYSAYIKKSQNVQIDGEQTSSWHTLRDVHQNAYKSMREFVRCEILGKERVYYLLDLYSQYKAIFFEIGGDEVSEEDFSRYRIDKFEKKVMDTFFGQVSIEVSLEAHSKKIVYKSDLDVVKLAEAVVLADSRHRFRAQDVAYETRRRILSSKSRKLPNTNLSLDDVEKGECDIPWFLYELISAIVRGPNPSRDEQQSDTVKIKSLCSDIMFVTSRGRLRPAKNIKLGLALKSMTGSRTVLTVLNRYGHCISYTGAEEIETEMTYAVYNEHALVPSGIVSSPNLCTNVAFDNFDCFVDTTNGKDTLHDTVGIIYQFVPQHNERSCNVIAHERTSSRNNETSPHPPSRKKRRFDEVCHDVRPYVHGKNISDMSLLSYDEMSVVIEGCKSAKKSASKKDLLWGVSLSQFDSTPMWLGYNARYYRDRSESQIVDYLQPINESPTSHSVVYETLCRSQEIAKECDQREIIFTGDLAVAKIAMAIQKNSSPEFDNIFINVGTFHFEMAAFKAIGKYIDSCGITDILMESGVLAHGSLNGFLDCKHYNRCKRIHPMLLAAFRSLHFQRFASDEGVDLDTLKDDLSYFFKDEIDLDDNETLPPSVNEILCRYEKFCQLTLDGAHGKTAQFYMTYMTFIEAILRLSRSIRSSDFELFLDSIFEIINLFFAMNLQNYARFASLFVSNLMKLKMNDSDLVDSFRRGAFGIKRTEKNFSRSPVDLTLEQTINADAANTSTGIIHFTNSIGARRRWALSHSLRTKILSNLKNELQMTSQDDVSHALKKNRLEKDLKNLKAITHAIEETLNPFDPSVDRNQLFNISTGKAASTNVEEFLLNVNTLGNDKKISFMKECNEDETRFSKPIKRNKVANFASDCVKGVYKSHISSKVANIKMERDIFGRLLAIAVEKKIDVEHCLSFPLAPMPPALFQCNGEMHETNKAAFALDLKSKVDQSHPQTVDVVLVDGFYFLHLLGSSIPTSYEKISRTILCKLCSNPGSEVHLIFDRYLTPSIKDCERTDRRELDIPYRISGPQQARPADFYKSLKNYRFKEELVRFLAEHWADPSLAEIYGNKKVYLTVDKQCFRFYSVNNTVFKQELLSLQCSHEEADTRIAFHIASLEPGSNVLVEANDTDVLVILLGNMEKFASKDLTIWLRGSRGKNNVKDCINCSELASSLGDSLCRSLPGFYAFTGCDYTAAFFLRGKKRPFKVLRDNVKFQELFTSLTDPCDIFHDKKMELVQEFTCRMYGVGKCRSVNSARFQIFQNNYQTKKSNEQFIKKMKGFDSTRIPPCWRSLKQKVLRTIYVTSMWQNATESTCTLFDSMECGWKIDGGILKPIGFVGDPSPLRVEDVLKVDIGDENESNEDDVQNSDSCEPASSDSEAD